MPGILSVMALSSKAWKAAPLGLVGPFFSAEVDWQVGNTSNPQHTSAKLKPSKPACIGFFIDDVFGESLTKVKGLFQMRIQAVKINCFSSI
jgi:hypothetical protein